MRESCKVKIKLHFSYSNRPLLRGEKYRIISRWFIRGSMGGNFLRFYAAASLVNFAKHPVAAYRNNERAYFRPADTVFPRERINYSNN